MMGTDMALALLQEQFRIAKLRGLTLSFCNAKQRAWIRTVQLGASIALRRKENALQRATGALRLILLGDLATLIRTWQLNQRDASAFAQRAASVGAARRKAETLLDMSSLAVKHKCHAVAARIGQRVIHSQQEHAICECIVQWGKSMQNERSTAAREADLAKFNTKCHSAAASEFERALRRIQSVASLEAVRVWREGQRTHPTLTC